MVFTTEAAIEAHIQKSHTGGPPFLQPRRPNTWQDWQSRKEEELEVPPMPCAETDALVVMDWMEEGTGLTAPSVPVSTGVSQSNFQPRPAFFPTGPSRSMSSPHDFRPTGVSPMVVVEYFCKVCGEIVPRLRFCAHISGHFTEIYLPRTGEPPRCITSDFIQQGGAPRKQPVRKDDCRTCALGGPGVVRLKQALQQLTEVFGPVEN